MLEKYPKFAMVCLLIALNFPIYASAKYDSLLPDIAVQRIKDRIFLAKEAFFVDAYRVLLEDADRYLSTAKPSVVMNGGSVNSHLYYTDRPYCGWFNFWGFYGESCRDGHINPEANRSDYQEAVRMATESVTLALAYRLSGKAIYADRLSEYIDHWIVSKESRITPQFTNGQSHIELTITHIGILYAIDLVWNYTNWNEEKKVAILEWIRQWGESVEQWQSSNNFEDWRIAFRLAIYRLTGDDKAMSKAISDFKHRITLVVSDRGEMLPELGRTKSLSYSLYAINAMMQSAELAYHYGVDLYRYRDQRGVGLETALNYHAPFVINQDINKWPHQQISTLEKSDVAIYELGYKRYGNEDFAAVIRRWERPLIEIRVLQYVSLTHGETLH
jgi:hypothetical protein